MTALCIIAAIVITIALLPVGVKARYDLNGSFVWVKIGPIYLKVFPLPEKGKKNEKTTKPKKSTVETPAQAASKGGSVELIKQLLPHALTAASRFLGGLVIKRLVVYYQAADEDPAKAAMQYGYGWAAVGLITGMIENVFTIRKRDLQVFVNFEPGAEKRIFVLAELTITVGQILRIAFGLGIEFLKIIIKNRKIKAQSAENSASNV